MPNLSRRWPTLRTRSSVWALVLLGTLAACDGGAGGGASNPAQDAAASGGAGAEGGTPGGADADAASRHDATRPAPDAQAAPPPPETDAAPADTSHPDAAPLPDATRSDAAPLPDALTPDAPLPDARPDASPPPDDAVMSLPDAFPADADAAWLPDAAVMSLPDAAVPLPDAARLPVDASVPDAAGPDAETPDAAPIPDAATPDAQIPDAALPDARIPDAAIPDAAIPDAAIPDAAPPPPPPLTLDEVVPDNRGVLVDGDGRPWPLVEVVGTGDAPADLSEWQLAVDDAPGWPLSDTPTLLEPGQRSLFFVPFALPRGSIVRLVGPAVEQSVRVPDDLPTDHALARFGGPLEPCPWATPGEPNGEACAAPPWPDPVFIEPFTSTPLPTPYPAPPRPLVLTELALRPAPGFVEVLNAGDAPVATAGWSVRISPQPPGQPWPNANAGAALVWPVDVIEPGARVTLWVQPVHVAALNADPLFEGVVTLFDAAGAPADRVDFMHWPMGAALAREGPDDANGALRFCATTTPMAADTAPTCRPMRSRPIGDRVRHLYTPGDFDALAAGNVITGTAGVKVVVDLTAGEVVHLLGNTRWDLHYTFVREIIEGLPHLSRCIPAERQQFNQGWSAFSNTNYFSDNRRYVLGTLYHYAANGLWTMEYTKGDRIPPALMVRAFQAAMRHVPRPQAFALRPSGPSQFARYHSIEGTVPIVEPDAPLRDATVQLLVPGVAYGRLRVVPTGALDPEQIDPETILITEEAPGDLPFVAGLITERPQSPNAEHLVAMLDRGAPSMALAGAADNPRLAPLVDQLVRFEVVDDRYSVTPATPEDAAAFWRAQAAARAAVPITPANLAVRGVVPLANLDAASVGVAGAHAAYMGVLSRLVSANASCVGPVGAPSAGFALALAHDRDHLIASGAAALLPAADSARADRDAALAVVREVIEQHPMDPDALQDFMDALAATFPGQPARLWPSSNGAGIRGFTGAGLFPPVELPGGAAPSEIEAAVKHIWASQWSTRAADERAFRGIAADAVAMGVFVTAAPAGAIAANGATLTRNLYFPLRFDHVMSLQRGLAPATFPAPGVNDEEIVYDTRTNEPLDRLDRAQWSHLSPDIPVLDQARLERLVCRTRVINSTMQPVIDPPRLDRWFMVDLNWWVTPAGEPVIDRLRPVTFGPRVPPPDCREL